MWTAIPFVLVTAIAIVSAIVPLENDAVGANPLSVNVHGAAVLVDVHLSRGG